jgi:uncharacterized membrane protein
MRELIRKTAEHRLFMLLFLACALLRLVPLCGYQFTYDELSALYRTQFSSVGELLEKGTKIDAHPALVQLFMYGTVKLFGYTTWVFKLPFILCSLAALIYGYRICERFINKQAGLVATVIFGFSLIFVYHAPIARMYINGVFFTLGMLYHFFEVFYGRALRRDYFLLGTFALLSALSHHINGLYALTLISSGFLFISRETLRPYLKMCIITLLLYLPHLPISIYQLGLAGIGPDQGGWLTPPGAWSGIKLMRVLLGTGHVWIVFVVGAVASAVLRRSFTPGAPQLLMLVLFIVNFLIVYIYSIVRAPIYQHSVMMFAGCGFVLFVSSLIHFPGRRVFAGFLGVVIIVLFTQTYIVKDYYGQAVKTVYEYQFERAREYIRIHGDQNVSAVFLECDQVMQKIYFQKYGAFKVMTEDSLLDENDRVKFTRYIASLRTEYLVLASATPAQQAIARHYFPFVGENIQTQAINFKVYHKSSMSDLTEPEDEVLQFSDIAHTGSFTYSGEAKAGRLPWSMPESEFPFAAKARYANIVSAEGQVILVSAVLKDPPLLTELCISVNRNDKITGYNSSAVSSFVPNRDTTYTVFTEHYCGTDHEKLLDGGTVSCYVWNRGKSRFLLQDFAVRVVDYRPRKWQFWD